VARRPAAQTDETLRLYLLGGFRVVVGGRTIDEFDWRLRKPRKLLALAPKHHLLREHALEFAR
jgi:hypothetical protein